MLTPIAIRRAHSWLITMPGSKRVGDTVRFDTGRTWRGKPLVQTGVVKAVYPTHYRVLVGSKFVNVARGDLR
jgi:hypothetical protein